MQSATNNEQRTTDNELLTLQGIEKSFFGVKVLKSVSFSVPAGGMVGLVGENGAGKSTLVNILGGNLQPGLMGAGRSELARILFGLDPREHGEVRLAGEVLHHLSPRNLIERGVAFLTENRRSEGLCLDAAVADNLALVTLPQHGRTPLRWLLRDSWQAAVTRIRSVVQLDSKTSNTQPVRTLSGGNQQKVVLGKWLLSKPKVLILDEPTRGIDVGAKFEIYRLIHGLADQGAGALVIYSELEELMGLCDRILVMRSGRLVDDLPRAQFDRERILAAALGTTKEVKS